MNYRIFLTALALGCFVTSCKRTDIGPKSSSPTTQEEAMPIALPETITLTDKFGRFLEAKIISRDVDEIGFIRLSDNKHFTWKISQLSDKDQAIIRTLPMVARQKDVVSATFDSLAVSNRQKNIDRLKQEIVLLTSQLPALQENTSKGISPRVKGVEKQIAQKEKEITVLEAEIQKYGN